MAHDLDRLDDVRLVPMTEATRLPKVVAVADLVPRIRSGVQLAPEVLAIPPEIYERFQVLDESGQLVAIARVDQHRVVYDRVFPA
jgi:hypothetical protein